MCSCRWRRNKNLIFWRVFVAADYIRQLLKVKNELRERSRELQTVLGETPDEDSSDEEADYTF
ncbi:hypothetical protein BDF14DRAFT_1754750 [Spinellus fusiger]|nr:hypothetical protein BDF14DRAFT_1754750 [Spinellus fusiger]